MEVLAILLAGGGGAAVFKLIETLTVWILNRRAKLSDEERTALQNEEARQVREQHDLAATVQNLKTAQRVILHDRIKYLGKSYIRAGAIDLEDLSDLIEMHGIYHNELDGNGKLDHLMGEVKKLPYKQ